MLAKLAVFLCVLGLTIALQPYNGPLTGGKPGSFYSAGISGQYQPQAPAVVEPQYKSDYSQQYKPTPKPKYTPEEQKRLDRGEYIGDGDYHGEGLAEALAPGYYTAAPAPKKVSAPAPGPAYYQSSQSYPQQPAHAQQTYQPAAPANFFESAQAPHAYQSVPVPPQAYPQKAALSYQQAAPSYQQAAPSYQKATQSYQQAAPSYQQATPFYQEAAPSYQKAASSYQQAAPSRSHLPVGNSARACPNYPYCH